MESGHEAGQPSGVTRVRPLRMLLGAVIRTAPQLRPAAEKLVWRVVYEAASLGRRQGQAPLNYGYAPLNEAIGSPPSDDHFGFQLYDKVAGAIPLVGLDVLEVGCGRGGGTAHVFDRSSPKSMVGLDLAASAIRRAESAYAKAGLRFTAGDAEALPFPDASFDAVLNVESSHCYPNVLRFLQEVHRVLRPGGHLLIADIRHTTLSQDTDRALFPQHDVQAFRRQIADAGFETLEDEDITPNVVHALELDSPRRRASVDSVPKLLRPHALALMAVEGTPMYEEFASHRQTYLRFLLRRP